MLTHSYNTSTPGMVTHARDTSTREADAEGPEVQGHSHLQSESEIRGTRDCFSEPTIGAKVRKMAQQRKALTSQACRPRSVPRTRMKMEGQN